MSTSISKSLGSNTESENYNTNNNVGSDAESNAEFKNFKITKIVDGDTIEVQKEVDGNMKKYKVRLLGINTPESVDPRREVECFGKEASAYAKENFLGKIVNLETDDTQDKYDKYDRLLAYIFLEDGQMINRKLIADGYAYEYTYDKPYKYQKDFKDIQRFAKSENRGLWSSDTCNGQK
jgi:micrococcal nuclease